MRLSLNLFLAGALAVVALLGGCATQAFEPAQVRVELVEIDTSAYRAKVEISLSRPPQTDGDYSYADASLAIANKLGLPLYFKAEDIRIVSSERQRVLVRLASPMGVPVVSVFLLRPGHDMRIPLILTTPGKTSTLLFQGVDLGDEEKQSFYKETYELFSKHGE